MFYTIYKTTNLINNKFYIGKHQTMDPNDSYYGSGVALKNSIKIHGKENFKKEVLFIFDSEEEMNLKEKELITEDFVARIDTYNMGVGGEGGAHFKGKKHSAETIAQITNTLNDPEIKKKYSEALKGKIPWNKGNKKNPEYIVKIPSKRKRNPMSEATKEKLRQVQIKRWQKQKGVEQDG
jgi:hypothetical protein